MENKSPFLCMKNIRKTFGSVVANNDVNLTVNSGEIHALLGENGAGKSTLMNILSGVYTPDSGSIFIHNKEVKFSSPKDAINAKIGMIYQHFKLVENLSALDNILLGQKNSFFINKKNALKRINEICSKYDLEFEPGKMVYNMSVGEKQVLEIIKVLYRGADILILDEPTTVFTPQESKKLFKIMLKMKSNGCAVIFITHKMDEVMTISDRITVLRKGETVKTIDKRDTSPKELAELMVGHKVDLSINKAEYSNKKLILEVKNISAADSSGIKVLKDVSFKLYSGEVLGVAGIANSGQKELCEALAGISKVNSGEILFQGENIVGNNPREIIKKGISMSFVPEDRLGMGLVGSMDMVDNLLLKSYHNQKGVLLSKKEAAVKAKEIKEKLSIQTPGIHYPIRNLSGGNIQKILLGRELDINPKVLIMAYPVRGLDINTCYTIYDLINEQKKKGVAVLYIGEDLDVLTELCDRIMVLCDGKVTGIENAEETSKYNLGLLMAGKTRLEEGA
ncbi:ABC transporter ATP-binding protein [Clostridium sp. JN-9]|uniref:ABC transporter ATP-binding protein n=1 Tax=Clostridium sp. JN-9 TaxID=2507159 RepID=UPI000FFE1FCF|nr:ABC transporter ATP-binding protein [Clostridium sp. JN-9]QAT39362.1 ABC transporter ATP-binding protein [Clostridium sp. JN-9]